jgi:hypothetical protein
MYMYHNICPKCNSKKENIHKCVVMGQINSLYATSKCHSSKSLLGHVHNTYISNVQDPVPLFCLEYDDYNSCSEKNAVWHQIDLSKRVFQGIEQHTLKALGFVNPVHSLNVIVSGQNLYRWMCLSLQGGNFCARHALYILACNLSFSLTQEFRILL